MPVFEGMSMDNITAKSAIFRTDSPVAFQDTSSESSVLSATHVNTSPQTPRVSYASLSSMTVSTSSNELSAVESSAVAFAQIQTEPFDPNFWAKRLPLNHFEHLLFDRLDQWGDGVWPSGMEQQAAVAKGEAYHPSRNIQFTLSYMLIPVERAHLLDANAQGNAIFMRHEKPYVRIFIHPSHYKNPELISDIQKVGGILVADDSAFVATPTASTRTLWVANRAENDSPPFLVKTSYYGEITFVNRRLTADAAARGWLLNQILNQITLPQGLAVMPEDAATLMPADFLDGNHCNQLFRQLPALAAGQSLISFMALVSCKNTPVVSCGELKRLVGNATGAPFITLLVDKFFQENEESTFADFIKTQIVQPYIKSAVTLLTHGISFYAHGQNLLARIKNGRIIGFVQRDFDNAHLCLDLLPENILGETLNQLPEHAKAQVESSLAVRSRNFNVHVMDDIFNLFGTYLVLPFCLGYYDGKVADAFVDAKQKWWVAMPNGPYRMGHYQAWIENPQARQTNTTSPNTSHFSGQAFEPARTESPVKRAASSDGLITLERRTCLMQLSDVDVRDIQSEIRLAFITELNEQVGEIPQDLRDLILNYRVAEEENSSAPDIQLVDWRPQDSQVPNISEFILAHRAVRDS